MGKIRGGGRNGVRLRTQRETPAETHADTQAHKHTDITNHSTPVKEIAAVEQTRRQTHRHTETETETC